MAAACIVAPFLSFFFRTPDENHESRFLRKYFTVITLSTKPAANITRGFFSILRLITYHYAIT
jgi:hypothetical protein